MSEMNILGIKSNKNIISNIIALIISILLLILFIFVYIIYLDSLAILFIILFSIITIYVLIILICSLIKPKIIIDYDEKGLYLHYSKSKSTYILFRNIENVSCRKIRSKYITYNFGFLIIETKDKKYKIGIIDNISDVRKYIYSRIAWKFKY